MSESKGSSRLLAHIVVVIEFPDQSTLDNWYYSEKYQTLIPLKVKAANVVIATFRA